MSVKYDIFNGAFLAKISEFEFMKLEEENRDFVVDGYLKRAISDFGKVCKYDLITTRNDTSRTINVDIKSEDIDELVNIISEGMIIQWLKQYVYQQQNLQNVINTKDFSMYSPAELLNRISETYNNLRKTYTQMIREYSYNHGDISELHL